MHQLSVRRHAVLASAAVALLSAAAVAVQPASAAVKSTKGAQSKTYEATFAATSCAVPDVAAALHKGRLLKLKAVEGPKSSKQWRQLFDASPNIKRARPEFGKAVGVNPLFAKLKRKPVVRASFAPIVIAGVVFTAEEVGGAVVIGAVYCSIHDFSPSGVKFRDWWEKWWEEKRRNAETGSGSGESSSGTETGSETGTGAETGATEEGSEQAAQFDAWAGF